jgi:hypothetical protein
LTLVTILLIWAIGLIFSLPFLIFAVYDPLFNPTDLPNNASNLITVCHLDANSSTARACMTWFIVILIFLPFFVLIYIYARIIYELARHRAVRLMTINKNQQQAQVDDETNSLNGALTLSQDNQQSNSFLAYKRFEQKRLNTVIICVVTVAFFACQFPVRIIQLIHMYVRVQNAETMPHLVWLWLWKLSKLLFFLNFTANPVMAHQGEIPPTSFASLDHLQHPLDEVPSVVPSAAADSSFVELHDQFVEKDEHHVLPVLEPVQEPASAEQRASSSAAVRLQPPSEAQPHAHEHRQRQSRSRDHRQQRRDLYSKVSSAQRRRG